MSTTLKKRKQLNSFLFRVMEPLSEEALIDYEYNRLAREARRTAWTKAEATVRLHRANLEVHDALFLFDRVVTERSQDEDNHFKNRAAVLSRIKFSTDVQIRTPAPDRASVEWKRKRLSDRNYSCTRRMTETEIIKCIAADEAFLAAHPIKKGRSS